jgi:hypothetical protein
LALATVIAYVASAMFHDLTLSPTDHWQLFLMAGVTVGLTAQQRAASATTQRSLASVSTGWGYAAS